MNAWLLSLDPQTSEWISTAGWFVFLLSLPLLVLLLDGKACERERRAFFDAHPRLCEASSIEAHAFIEAVVMWDVEREVFVARCLEVSEVCGRGYTVDEACKALQKAVYERAKVSTLRRDRKVVATRSLEVYVAEEVAGADGAAACASC